MGLFSSKKKEKAAKSELPPLKFPDLPQEEFPEFKQQQISPAEASAIKEAVSPAPMAPPKMEQPSMEPTEMGHMGGGEKPLFVKVEKYKDVLESITELKEKLKDAGEILAELSRIKDEEENELNTWQQDLEQIKQKLMTIDQTLFES